MRTRAIDGGNGWEGRYSPDGSLLAYVGQGRYIKGVESTEVIVLPGAFHVDFQVRRDAARASCKPAGSGLAA